MEKLKRKLRTLGWAFVLIMMIIGIRFAYERIDSRRIINDRTLERNITSISHHFEQEPDLDARGIAWENELPQVVSEDIQYLREHEEVSYIEYTWNDWLFEIQIGWDDEPNFNASSRYYYNSSLYDASNFSIYTTKDGGVVVYGNDIGMFVRYEFQKDDYDREYITYNTSVPFTEKDSTIVHFGSEYAICFPEAKDKMYVYRDGEIVSEKYEMSNIRYIFGNGLVLTESNELIMLYVIPTDDGRAEIKIEPVGKVPDVETWEGITIDNSDESYLSLPIFTDEDGRMWMPAPKNWDNLFAARKAKTIDNPNYAMEMVELGKDTFKKAVFQCSTTGSVSSYTHWFVDIIFDVNGREVAYQYSVNGYDRTVECPEGELPETKTVTNAGEFWDFITTIRETYAQYYDYPDGT